MDEAVQLSAELVQTYKGLGTKLDTAGKVAFAEAALLHATNLEEAGRGDEATEFFKLSLQQRQLANGKDHPRNIESLRTLAWNLQTGGQLYEAEPLIIDAIRIARRALASATEETEKETRRIELAASLNLYANNISDQGRTDEALPIYQQVVRLHEEMKNVDPEDLRSVRGNLATSLSEAGRLDEAVPIFQQIISSYSDVQTFSKNNTQRRLCGLYSTNNRHRDAEECYRQIIAAFERDGDKGRPWVFQSKGYLAQSLLAMTKYAEAERLAREAVAGQDGLLKISVGGSEFRSFLSRALLAQQKNPKEALLIAKEAAAIARKRRASSGGGVRQASNALRQALDLRRFARLVLDASAAQVKPTSRLAALDGDLLAMFQEALTSPASQAVAQMATRQTTLPELSALAARRQELQDQWQTLERNAAEKLGEAASPSNEEVDTIRSEQARIEAQIGEADAEIRRQYPEYYSLVEAPPLSLGEAFALVGAEESVIMIAPSEMGTHVALIDQGTAKWHTSRLSDREIRDAVSNLRKSLASEGLTEAEIARVELEQRPLPFSRADAFLLYRELLAPLEQHLQGKTHLYVVAGGALASLPFGVLVTSPPAGSDQDPDALLGTDWLQARFAIVQLPSLQALQAIRRKRPSQPGAQKAFAGFGDPVLEGPNRLGDKPPASSRGGQVRLIRSAGGGTIVSPADLKALDPLPGTATELTKLAQAFGREQSEVYLREKATEPTVRNTDLNRFKVVAFATHGLLAGAISGVQEPGLVLTPPASATENDDGFLAASEVAQLRLSADWVILSACDTAGGDAGPESEALSGLARAFFYAGASSLLASHWPVRDDVAAQVTVEAILKQQQNQSLTRAKALQLAITAIRTDPNDKSRAHPAAWAPFTLVGEGR
jgi:CHAT domain-containing protein